MPLSTSHDNANIFFIKINPHYRSQNIKYIFF